MFVRLNRNSQGKAYLQLVRSYREGGKVRQQVLFTLGRLDVLQSTGQMDNLVAALGRYATKEKLVDLSKDISIDQVYFLGAAHVVSRMMERLKLTALFTRLRAKHPRMKLPWVGIITGMILSRFIEPCSKRRLNRDVAAGLKIPEFGWFENPLGSAEGMGERSRHAKAGKTLQEEALHKSG